MASAHLLLDAVRPLCHSERRAARAGRRRQAGSLLEVMNGCQPEGALHVLHVTEEQVFFLTPELLFLSPLKCFQGAFIFFKR